MTRKDYLFLLAVVLLVAAGNAGTVLFLRKDVDKKVVALKSQISGLQGSSGQVKSDSSSTAVTAVLPQAEIDHRQAVHVASQDELLTSAVAKTTPAVVSVVISKDVPQLEVTYVNPFGDDPFFKDFGARVPVYRQKGTVRQKVGGGTGFLVTSDGYIVTNRHVVEDDAASYTVLLADGSQQPAQVIYKDQQNDLAVIKIPGSKYATVSLGDSGSLKLGQTVIAIGNALAEYNNSVSVGIISGLNRSIQASSPNGQTEQLSGIIQTDAAINPGNSGGPLVDLNGNVVGINVATVTGTNSISFSIPIDQVKGIIAAAKK